MSLGSKSNATAVGGPPSANLLPPEVAQRARDRSALSWSILALVLVGALVAAGVGLAFVRNITAQAALITAQTQGQALIAEQQEYAEVGEIRSAIGFSEQARIAVTNTEVDWAQVYAALAAVLPADAVITGFGASVPAPWQPSPSLSGPLRAPLVGSVAVTLTSPSIEGIAQFARSAQDLDFVADVSVDTLSTEGTISGVVTVNLNVEALLQRFAVEVEEDAAAEETSTEEPATEEPATEEPATEETTTEEGAEG